MRDPINILEVKKEARKALDSEIETIRVEACGKFVEDLKSLVFKISKSLDINTSEVPEFISKIVTEEFSNEIIEKEAPVKKLIRLTNSDVKDISNKLKANFKVTALSREYGVSYSRINLIKKGLGLCKTRKGKSKATQKRVVKSAEEAA